MMRTSALKHNPTFSQHLRLILLSKSVIADHIGMDAIINQFVRDNGTRRSSYVFVTDGRTKDIFKMNDQGEPASNVIYDLTENNAVTIRMMEPVTLGEISEHLTSDDSFLIPHVGKENGKLAINGAAIIKNKLWNRNLTPVEVQNINLFTGTVEGGVIDMRHNGNLFLMKCTPAIARSRQTTRMESSNSPSHAILKVVYQRTGIRMKIHLKIHISKILKRQSKNDYTKQ